MLRCILNHQLSLQRNLLILSLSIATFISLIQYVSSTFVNRNKPVLVNTNQQQVSSELMDPVNPPSMSQEYARYLSQYMQNLQRNDYWPQLNLAQMNSRAQLPVRINSYHSTSQTPEDQPLPHRSSFMTELVAPQSSVGPRRLDKELRKGKVDDVLIFKDHMQGTKGGYSNKNWLRPVMPPLKEKLFHENCITRATKLVSTCEDHLIRRLSQDAAEGRTVIDVGRRVCCALFWHKDCISSKVVQACPDSSPAAVDYLLGSRKVDLTLSCQKFNRDGCNGAESLSLSASKIALQLLLLYSMLLLVIEL